MKVHRQTVPIDGAILVWGAATPSGCAVVCEEHGLAEVLTVESMIGQLIASNNPSILRCLGLVAHGSMRCLTA